jgi:hypothetical protein
MNSMSNSLNKMKRCKSTGSVIFNKSALSNTSNTSNHNHNHHSHESHQHGSGGIPWRTAARANRYRVSTSCAQRKVGGSSSFKGEGEEEYEEEDEDGNYDDLVDDYTQNKENMEASEDNVEFVENNNGGLHRTAKGQMTNSTFADSRNGAGNGNSNSNVLVNSRQNRKQQQAVTAEKSEFRQDLDKIKNMSVKDLLVILQREQESKSQLEDMLIKVGEP